MIALSDAYRIFNRAQGGLGPNFSALVRCGGFAGNFSLPCRHGTFPSGGQRWTGLATIEPELKEIMYVLKARPADIL